MTWRFLPYLVLIGAFILFFRDLPGQTFILRDALNLFAPEGRYLASLYRSGYFPLWNPGYYLGSPFLAQMIPAAFYPLTFLQVVLPSALGFPSYVAVHYLLAGLFMFWWLKRLALSPAAALLGALAFMESGYLVSMQGTLNYLACLPWFPLALLAFDRLLARPGRRPFLLAAAVFTVPGLVGDPLTTGVWLLLFFALLFGQKPATGSSPRRLALIAGLVILSGLFLAVQFWPTLELLPWSERAAGYSFDEITQWSFHPGRILEWIFPQIWGYAWPDNRFWARFLVFGANAPWAMSTYLGLVPLLGIILALSRPRSRLVWLMLLLTLLFLLLAGGRYLPFYKIFLFLPGMKAFRFPEKFLAPVTFLLCTLAALGADRLDPAQRPAGSRFFKFLPLSFSAVLAAAGLLGYLLREPAADWLHDLVRAKGFDVMPAALLGRVLGKSFGHTLFVSLSLALIFAAPRFYPKLERWTLLALILVGWLDLHTAHRPLLALAPADLFQGQPQAAQILLQAESGHPQTFRIHRDPFISFPSRSAAYPKSSILVRSRAWEYETLLPDLGLDAGLADALGYTPARPGWVPRISQVSNRAFWNLTGVKYLVWGIENASPPLPEDLKGLEEVGRLPDLNLVIFRNREALPRAYAVTGVRWARDPAAAIRDLQDTDFPRQVILLGAGQSQPGNLLVPARLTQAGDQRFEFTVDQDLPGYFVLADSYVPGWQARVNGAPARILRADDLVRAVAIPAGPSRLGFLYRPWGFRLGLWISLGTLISIVIMFAHIPARAKNLKLKLACWKGRDRP